MTQLTRRSVGSWFQLRHSSDPDKCLSILTTKYFSDKFTRNLLIDYIHYKNLLL